MNDRCAAGTGRFLEVLARALDREVHLPPLPQVVAAMGAALSVTMCESQGG